MATSKYFNTDWTRVPDEGGSLKVTLSDGVGQGNGGTSLPCKVVWLQTDGTDVMVNIGAAVDSTYVGIQVPWVDVTNHVWNVLEIPIDDVSKLYFKGTSGKIINILYRL